MINLIAKFFAENSSSRQVSWFDYNVKTLFWGILSSFILIAIFSIFRKRVDRKVYFFIYLFLIFIGFIVYKISFEYYTIIDIRNYSFQ